MGAQLSDEIKTFFTGDSTGLAKEVDKAKKLVASLQKDYSKHVTAVKGSILDPGSLVGKAGEKLASSLKLSATGMGLAAGGGAVLLKTFQAANRLAGEQADKLRAMADTMQDASRVNMFSSSLSGTATLVQRLNTSRELTRAAVLARQESNPFGFGHGIVGNMRTVMGKGLMASENAVGLGYSNFDRQRDADNLLKGNIRLAQQQAAHMRSDLSRGLVDQLGLTKERLSGSSFNSRIAGLHRERRGELNSIKGTDAYTPENRRNIRLRYNEEISAERELQTFSELRFRRLMGEQGIQRELISDEGKRVLIIERELEGTREQLQLGKHLTTEARQSLTLQREQQRTELLGASLDFKKHIDSVAANKLEIKGRQELVAIGQRGIEASRSMADLDVQAAEQARDQAHGMKEYLQANERLKDAVAARLGVEETIVATQRESSDLAFGLALHLGRINGTNGSSIAKRAQSNESNLAAMQAELSLPGTTEERGRQLALGIQGGENTRRELLQERGYGKSPAAIQRELHREQVDRLKRDQFDARMGAADGLSNIQRDINGRAVSGIDLLTGQRRAPHAEGNLTARALRQVDAANGSNPAMMQVQTSQLETQKEMAAQLKAIHLAITNTSGGFA